MEVKYFLEGEALRYLGKANCVVSLWKVENTSGLG